MGLFDVSAAAAVLRACKGNPESVVMMLKQTQCRVFSEQGKEAIAVSIYTFLLGHASVKMTVRGGGVGFIMPC